MSCQTDHMSPYENLIINTSESEDMNQVIAFVDTSRCIDRLVSFI